jgi:hypothetical protein
MGMETGSDMIGSTKVRQFQLTKNSIVAETFRIYKSNGIELASIQLFLSGPLLLISLYCESSLSDYIFSDQVTGETFQYIDNLVAILLIAMGLRLIVSPIGYAIQYFAISKILQDKKFHWKDAWPIVRIKAGSLIVAYFLFILTIVFAGLIFSTVWILISLSWDGGLMLILISTGLFTIFLLFLLILFIMLPLHILTHSQPLGMHISQTSRLAYRNFRVIPVLLLPA